MPAPPPAGPAGTTFAATNHLVPESENLTLKGTSDPSSSMRVPVSPIRLSPPTIRTLCPTRGRESAAGVLAVWSRGTRRLAEQYAEVSVLLVMTRRMWYQCPASILKILTVSPATIPEAHSLSGTAVMRQSTPCSSAVVDAVKVGVLLLTGCGKYLDAHARQASKSQLLQS